MSTTSVDVIEPGEERLLVQQLDQEFVDRAFWRIVNAGWPPVVKTGTALIDDESKQRWFSGPQPPGPADDTPARDGRAPEERSPPDPRQPKRSGGAVASLQTARCRRRNSVPNDRPGRRRSEPMREVVSYDDLVPAR